jgi:hypothetical protein
MFCPSCGFEYTQKTNFCKRCGADLNPAGATAAHKKTQLGVSAMFWGVIAFCLTAVSLVFGMFDHFQRAGRCDGKLCHEESVLLIFVALFLFVVSLLLFWQLARMGATFRRTGENTIVEKHFIREVPTQPVAPTGQMPEAPEAIYPLSVVEHTTRQMAGVYNEPKATK